MWYVNGISYTLKDEEKSKVLIDVCSQLGFDIPRFCYHENLKIAGNCRMCLIEDTKAPKPVISCASSLSYDINIYTNTLQVKKSREAVMEFLPINHPLDCPICDQGGECDLQDLALIYGSDHGRFYDYKKNVQDKNCGPIIKTVMNRCILRTRCVRFASDIAGFEAFGLTGRGGKMEIGSYIEKIIDSELSGNIADICPVGALTTKPYAFVSRPWELKKINFINILDDLPQTVRADVKENEIVRFLPSKNTFTNTWITNRTRFSYEGLLRSRVLNPLVFGFQVSWVSLISIIKYWLIEFKKMFSFRKLSQSFLFFKSFNEILSNTDLQFVKFLVTSLGSYAQINLIVPTVTSIYFLPISDLKFITKGYKNFYLFSTDTQFEIPLLTIAVVKQLTFLTNPLVVKWRSNVSSLLNKFTITLNNSFFNLLKLLSNKLWCCSLLWDEPVMVLCKTNLYTDIFAQQNNTILNYNYFLISKNISERYIWDENFATLTCKTPLSISHSLTLQDTAFNSSSSLIQLAHCTSTKFFFLSNFSFLTPAKASIEGSNTYSNLDYSYLVVHSVLSSSILSKSLKNWMKVLSKLFGVLKACTPIKNQSSCSLFFMSCLKSLQPTPIYQNSCYNWEKLISQSLYYSELAILSLSPTLASLNNFNKHIY